MKRKCLFLFLWLSIFVLAFWLGVWTAWTERHAHYTPEYEMVDIVPILRKRKLGEADYQLLFRQTGMNRLGVDALRERGRQSELLYLQERFFAEVELVCLRDMFVVQSERLVGAVNSRGENVGEPATNIGGVRARATMQDVETKYFLPTVQTGDILISFSGHVFGWRNGHAAIVIDAEEGLTLEAITMGSDSRICNIAKWAEYPCYALLRLKGATAEERAEIAGYAAENLVGISYRLLSFSGESKVAVAEILGPETGEMQSGSKTRMVTAELEKEAVKMQESLTGTHCAHLVWSAYAHYGYDLDSDGGVIVTPRDIFDSDLLEVVQLYGLNPAMVEVE